MQILVNGEVKQFTGGVTVAALLEAMGLAQKRVAVEVNREIVPRSQHLGHRLQDRDCVEVVNAIGGG